MNRDVWLGFAAGLEELFEKQANGVMKYLGSDRGEHHGDMGGLAAMALSSADRLRSQVRNPSDHEDGSLMGGTVGRSSADMAGLGMMAAPTLAAMAHGHGSKFTNRMNLAGLGTLAIPTIDNIQAHWRAKKDGSDPETKMLLGHKAHALAELGGYGMLAAPVISKARGDKPPPLASTLATLGGYGALTAPVVEDLVQHDEKKKVFSGALRSATELGGLGLLAGGAVAGH